MQVAMSATPQTSPITADLSQKAHTLAKFLKNRVSEEGGEMYVKGKFIADEVGLSAKEIGALMIQLQECDLPIQIEAWSYTGATTWRVAENVNN